ncbi:hypothetical protein DXG03_005181 [Asterophora parasitica]|uniref:NADH-ubiquinone oxidoreductase B15 subunit n=1 Tax=Asterophora parasitica TaxID=117018 RepID=A0A9P7KDZ7_9AGAR|nr:hypothetical protein DXG03_005181 [Asterophora parasitica]
MAGNPLVKEDPAIERFNRMREEAYLKFRWTSKTVRTAIVGFIILPSAVYYLASEYQVRYLLLVRKTAFLQSPQNKFNWLQRKGQPLLPTTTKSE